MILNLRTYKQTLESSQALARWEATTAKFSDQDISNLENARLEAVQNCNTLDANRLRDIQDEIQNAAVRLSNAIFDSMGKSRTQDTVLVIGNSTGKDSTAVMALAANWLKSLKEAPKTLVTIADTRSEFPSITQRMKSEQRALNLWAAKHDLDLECHIQEPAVKSRLLVELIGNGKPLPALGSSTKSEGPSNWCMDRVKAQPIQTILKMVQGKGSKFIHALGTRFAESTKREGTMIRYNEGLPYGLGRMRLKKGATNESNHEIQNALCFQPIAHWPDWLPFRYLESILIPWDPLSIENLKEAYDLAAPDGGSVKECGLRTTEDGSLTSVCEGLDGSGARMGCWMCFKVKNRSLINMAKKDQRYAALREFHSHLMQIHKNDKSRRLRRDQAGFDKYSFCSRTFLFRERYYMLMLLFKAIIESGFNDLINAEELQQIELFWQKHGVFTISTDMARKDAERWVQTGEMIMSWDRNVDFIADLGSRLSEGLNLAAYWHLLNPGYQSLDWQRLLCWEEISTPLIPKVQSYVFHNWHNGQYTTLVTDCFGPMVTRSNKSVIDELVSPDWSLVWIREPNSFERGIGLGKSFFYSVDGREACRKGEDPRLKLESGDSLEDHEIDNLSIAHSVLGAFDFENRESESMEDENLIKPGIIQNYFRSLPPELIECIDKTLRKLDPIIMKLTGDFSHKIRLLNAEFPSGCSDMDSINRYRRRATEVFGVMKNQEQLEFFSSKAPLELISEYIDGFKELGRLIFDHEIHPVLIEKLLDELASSANKQPLLVALSTNFEGVEPDYAQIIPEVYY